MGKTTKTNRDAQRRITIKNFRNIGYADPTSITLNRGVAKDEVGELVILIGLNNTGKSNVLAAISAGRHGTKPEDASLSAALFGATPESPKITLQVFDGDGFEYTGSYMDVPKEKRLTKQYLRDYIDRNVRGHYSSITDYVRLLDAGYVHSDVVNNFVSVAESEPESEMAKVLLHVFKERAETFEDGFSENIHLQYIDKKKAQIVKFEHIDRYYENLGEENRSDAEMEFRAKHGYNLFPNVIEYRQNTITSSHCNCEYTEINPFLTKVLNSIAFKKEQIDNIFKSYVSTKNFGPLEKIQDEMNVRLEAISDKFNRMYGGAGDYEFKMRLGDRNLTLYMLHGDKNVDLDRQSTGFRWFFDFYFNVILSDELKWGDIVLLDEPATNLHPQGQVELRDEMRRAAKNIGITFVMSTHSPFFIDIDHLDEVRTVIRQEDGNSIVVDKFNDIENESVDQLSPILRFMTISRHILVDPKDMTVFVEGITDYNYLVMFKKILIEEKNLEKLSTLRFFPINGVAKAGIPKALKSIERNPILLVDGDKTGLDFKKKLEGDPRITVFSLDEFNQSFKTVESLFSKEDDENLGIAYKKFNKSSVLKNKYKEISLRISDETKENFEKVLVGLYNV